MLIAGAVQAGTQIYAGYKQKEAAETNAELLRQQGIQARIQAGYAKTASDERAASLQQQGQAFRGTQKSVFAGSGVKVSEGSPLAVMKESQRAIQQDVGRLQQMGGIALKQGQSQYDVLSKQASQLEQQGKDVFTASLIGAGSTFLTSMGSSGFDFNNIFQTTPKKSLSQSLWDWSGGGV